MYLNCPRCSFFGFMDEWNESTKEAASNGGNSVETGGLVSDGGYVVCPRCENEITIEEFVERNEDYFEED